MNNKKVTMDRLVDMKRAGEKIVSLTAYDAAFARIVEEAGVELVLVGDSLGMALQGEENTLRVTMDDMLYHTSMVSKTVCQALLVADMPYKSYSTPEIALSNAKRFISEAGAEVVKLEGGQDIIEVIEHLQQHGIPVCGHLGLQPQSVLKYGGFKVQGREKESADQILADAKALQDAGVMMIVLECIPSELAEEITKAIDIPTIGIGAGPSCDGQILVLYDVLGVTKRLPHMAKNFLEDQNNIYDAVNAYVKAVKDGTFPDTAHSYN